MRQVIIEQWHDPEWTHCHEPRFNVVNSRNGDAVESSVADFVEIATLAGSLKQLQRNGKSWLNCNCIEICELVSQVLCYSEPEIDKIRTQFAELLEHYRYVDENCEPIKLSRFELALLDISARDSLAARAREVDNPFQVDKSHDHYLMKMADKYLRARAKAC